MSTGLKIALVIIGLAITTVTVYAISVFRGSADHLTLVPKNSALVLAVNLKNLGSKVDLKEIMNMNIMKQVSKKKERKSEEKIMDDVFKNPRFSGVDPFSNIYFFCQSANENGFAGGFVIHLLSASGFEGIVEKNGNKNPVEDKGSYKRVKINDNAVVAWNSDAALIYIGDFESSVKECDKIMNQKKDESILEMKRFRELDRSVNDFSFFVNYDIALKNLALFYQTYSFMDEDSRKALKEAYLTGTLNFEKDKIAMDFKNHIKYTSAYEKNSYLKKSGLSADHMKTISPDKIYAICSGNINMKKFIDMYKKDLFVGVMIEQLKTRHSLSDDELNSLLTGEISIALVNFDEFTQAGNNNAAASVANAGDNGTEQEANTSSFYGIQPKLPTFSGTVSVKNKKIMEKILGDFELVKGSEGYYTIPGGMPVYMVEIEQGYSITNSKSFAHLLQSKKEFKKPADPVKSLLEKYPSCFYADLDLSHYPPEVLDYLKASTGAENFDKFLKTSKEFKSVIIKTDKYNVSWELLFSEDNGKGNSLMRLIKMMDEVSEEKG